MLMRDVCQWIIRPALETLERWSPEAEQLLQLAWCSTRTAAPPGGLGPFGITAQQHEQIWDGYLAFQPEQASRVRGLASQRRFLECPHQELVTNLAYSTAIAWLLLERLNSPLPALHDTRAQRRLWQQASDCPGTTHQRPARLRRRAA